MMFQMTMIMFIVQLPGASWVSRSIDLEGWGWDDPESTNRPGWILSQKEHEWTCMACTQCQKVSVWKSFCLLEQSALSENHNHTIQQLMVYGDWYFVKSQSRAWSNHYTLHRYDLHSINPLTEAGSWGRWDADGERTNSLPRPISGRGMVGWGPWGWTTSPCGN